VTRLAIAVACLTIGPLAAQTQPAGAGPCSLVTGAEVQAAVGSPSPEGVINATNKAVCDYKIGNGILNVTLTPKGPGDSAEKTVAELKKRNIAATVVPGLGDSAYSSSPGYGMQQLGVFKGGSQVIVTVMLLSGGEAKAKAAADAVVRKALPRVK
jgi:hypothetical protein